jgi:hypothetical protein
MDFFRVIYEESPSGQPSIELFGVTIMEPMVTFTDLWITAVALFAFWKLRQWNQPGSMHAYMRWYFLLMGIATFFGGILGGALFPGFMALMEKWAQRKLAALRIQILREPHHVKTQPKNVRQQDTFYGENFGEGRSYNDIIMCFILKNHYINVFSTKWLGGEAKVLLSPSPPQNGDRNTI